MTRNSNGLYDPNMNKISQVQTFMGKKLPTTLFANN